MQKKHHEGLIQTKPVFVKTKNVRNFEVIMDGLALGEGEGRLAVVWSRAGRGKSRTSQWFHGHHDSVYLRVATVWRTSEMEFLKALCRELGIIDPPKRKGACFTEIVDQLVSNPIPVFIDEIEKLPRGFLDVVRDISDISTAPFVLIGEEELYSLARQNRRVWSRIFQTLQFDPISVSDIMLYTNEFTGLTISMPVAGILHKSSGGDFRIVRRDLLLLVQYANAKGTREIDEQMAKIAVKQGLTGA